MDDLQRLREVRERRCCGYRSMNKSTIRRRLELAQQYLNEGVDCGKVVFISSHSFSHAEEAIAEALKELEE